MEICALRKTRCLPHRNSSGEPSRMRPSLTDYPHRPIKRGDRAREGAARRYGPGHAQADHSALRTAASTGRRLASPLEVCVRCDVVDTGRDVRERLTRSTLNRPAASGLR